MSQSPSSRITRCLRLLTKLQSRFGYNAWDLAHECDVSKRTIYRDLGLLAGSGIPVSYDSERRGYILQSRSIICAVADLTDDELSMLLLAAHIFSLSCEHEVSRSIRLAIDKLLNRTSPRVRDEVAGLLSSVGGTPTAAPWPQGLPPVVAEILTSLRLKQKVRIVYRPSEEAASSVQTLVTPHRLLAAQGHWYLVGRSSWHRKVRRFDLQHIRHAEHLEDDSGLTKSPLSHAQTHR